jgi:glycosyltransferase involved in cell wall biosynthesis
VKEHFLGWFSTLFAGGRIPVVRTVHGDRGVPRGLGFRRHLRSRLVVGLDNLLIGNVSRAVIAVSKEMEKGFLDRSIRGKTYQIYNSIKTNEFAAGSDSAGIRRKYDIRDDFWIGTAARLVEVKNQKMLIEAGRQLANRGVPFRISIFGEGPLNGELESLINRYGLSGKVFLHGFEPQIHGILGALDAFVLCSRQEGLPMALLEAMYAGTPVICTAVGGMKEIIEDEVNGMLVPVDDSYAIARCVEKLYKNEGLAVRLGTNGKTTVEDRFSSDKAAGLLCMAYEEVLA